MAARPDSAFPMDARGGVRVPMTNATSRPVTLYWCTNAGVEKYMDTIAPGGQKVWSVHHGNGGWIAKDSGKEVLVVSSSTVYKDGFIVGKTAPEKWEAPNGPRTGMNVEGPPVPKTFRFNRNSPFKKYLLAHGWREAARNEMAQLGHWDTHKVGPCHADKDSWPRSSTNCLDNIWTYFSEYTKPDCKIVSLGRSSIGGKWTKLPLTRFRFGS